MLCPKYIFTQQVDNTDYSENKPESERKFCLMLQEQSIMTRKKSLFINIIIANLQGRDGLRPVGQCSDKI